MLKQKKNKGAYYNVYSETRISAMPWASLEAAMRGKDAGARAIIKVTVTRKEVTSEIVHKYE